jgi:hypothetical protein
MVMSHTGHGTKRARAGNSLPDHTNSDNTVFEIVLNFREKRHRVNSGIYPNLVFSHILLLVYYCMT